GVQSLRNPERLQCEVRRYEDCSVRAHGETGAQLLLALCRSDRDNDDFLGYAPFTHPKRFFERYLVEGIDTHFGAFEGDPRSIRLHLHPDAVVEGALQSNKDLHGWRLQTFYCARFYRDS